MSVALPPIDEQAFEQHATEQVTQRAQTDLAALETARMSQEQAEQAAALDVQQRARAQIADIDRVGQDAAEAQAVTQRARAQVDAIGAAPRVPGLAPSLETGSGLGRVYADARAAGLDEEGARAAVAVAATEGGMSGTTGDQGQSAGTFQLHHGGGQGTNYARALGISPQESIARLRQDPHAANQWALGGYLGQAIREGQARGLRGAELATYAQQVGQRSVSPERAGASYAALQGQSFDQSADSSFLGPAPIPGQEPSQYARARVPEMGDERAAIRQRAESYLGTPYLWGGADKQGIDCSAFISRAWGVGRQTTDTLDRVAEPIPKEELTPGDALNLTTGADPRGYGHVRMFDGWADPEHRTMYVYESSTATGGVARRVIPYDGAYTPMRLRGLGAADPTAYQVAMHTRAPPSVAEQAAPGRPTTVPIVPEGDRPPSEFEPPSPFPASPFERRVPEVTGPVTVAGATTPTAPTRPTVEPPIIEGERPPSEFEPPSAFAAPPVPESPEPIEQTLARLGRLAAPALTGQYAQMGTPAALEDVRALGRQVGAVGAERERSLERMGRAAVAGEPLPLDEQTLETALALTPEPIAGAGGRLAGRLAGEAAEVARLRLDKFPEAVRDTIQAAVTAGDDFWRTQRRGVIPDEAAEQMADRLGRSVDQLIAGGKAAKAYTTEETRALRNAVTAQAVKVSDLAEGIARDPTRATPALIAEQVAEGMKLADLTRVAEGARAEAGRTLRAYTAFTRDYAANPQDAVQRIFRANNLTPEQATQKANAFATMVAQGADPFQMARFWANVEPPPVNAGDWFRLLRYNAMLSGPRTMEVNVASGLTEVPWRALRDVGASVLTGDVRPLVPEAEAAGAGLLRGLQGARAILAHGLTEEQALAGDVPRSLSARLEGRVPRTIATALEAPGRVLGASDEVVRQVAYGMARGREAGRQASREGLSGGAWRARVDELMAQTTPSPGAGAVAERTTFKGPMGELGEKVLAPLQQWSPMGVPVGNVLVPFLRSVYHITSQGVERTPVLGTLGAAADVARGTYGPITRTNLRQQLSAMEGPAKGITPLGERVGNNLMGSVAFAGLGLAAAQGNITGKGPSDPEKRRMMQAQGWQPYSVRIGGKWVSYANWGPMAVPLSMAAAIHEREGKTTPEQIYDVFERGANVLTEQSYLQGVGAIFKAMDPTRGSTFGEQSLEQFLATLVPFGSAINTLGQATDPLMRANERGDITGALAARIPGLRETVPAQQDVLGRPVPNPQQGLAAAQPLRTSPERPDPVLGALRAANVDVPAPPKTITRGRYKDIPLTEAEQRTFQRIAGDEISRVVGERVASEAFQTDTPEGRAKRLQQDVDKARQVARNQVTDAMSDEDLERRTAKPAA